MGIEAFFNPEEEHVTLRKDVSEFTRKEIEPQAAEHDKLAAFNHGLFKLASQQGYLGCVIPDKYGGAEMDSVSAVILYEEISKSDPGFAMSLLAHTVLFGHNLAMNGSESQKISYLPKIVSGEIRAGMGMTTPEAGTDVLGMKTKADRDGNYWRINGTKQFITNPDGELFLVYARTGKERSQVSLFIVESGYPGFSMGELEHNKMGMRPSPTGQLVFDDCIVPLDNLVGDEGNAVEAMKRNLEIERVTLSAISTGIALRCIEEMVSYAKERTSFGNPLISYGQIKEKIASSYTQTQAARAFLYAVARSLDPNIRNPLDADAVKLMAANVGTLVSDHAIQVLGGSGYCGNRGVERLYRDARLLRIGGGTDEAHQNNIVAQLKK